MPYEAECDHCLQITVHIWHVTAWSCEGCLRDAEEQPPPPWAAEEPAAEWPAAA
jgi:hypothetical protein